MLQIFTIQCSLVKERKAKHPVMSEEISKKHQGAIAVFKDKSARICIKY